MTYYVVFFVNFHGEQVFSGVFSTRENAETYIARFPGETFEIEPTEVDPT